MSTPRWVKTLPPPHVWIPLQVIKNGVNQTTWERGQSLFQQRAVVHFDIEPLDEHWQVFGEVQGTSDIPYQLTIEVNVDMTGQPNHWNSECTCPVGWRCKHAIALLLEASHHGLDAFPDISLPGAATSTQQRAQIRATIAEEMARQRQIAAQAVQEAQERQWLQWLDHLECSASTPVSTGPSSSNGSALRENRFIYLLSLAEKDAATTWHQELIVQLAQSYLKKTGGWAKPQFFNHVPLPNIPLYAQASDADRTTIELLRSMCQLPWRSGGRYNNAEGAIVLQGPMVATLLQTAASTGRLFVLQHDGQIGPPVQWGSVQSLAWHWVQHPADDASAAQWQLQAQVGAQGNPTLQLCTNQPPLYFDGQNGLCGPVEAPGWTPTQLSALLQAPPASSQVLEKHQRRLVERLGKLPLPAVIQKQVSSLKGHAPSARLHLCATPPAHNRAPAPQNSLLTAQLRFDYQGLRGWWPLSTPSVLLEHPQQAGQQVLLQRDLAAEQQAIANLQNLGLQASDDNGHFQLWGAAQHQQWLQWLDDDFASLRAAGFEIDTSPALQDWITRADTLNVQLQPEDDDSAEGGSTSPWFELSLGIDIHGQRYNLLPLLPELIALLAQSPLDPMTGQAILPPFLYLPALDGGPGFVRLPMHTLQPWLAALLDLVGERQYDFNADSLRLSRLDALRTSAALGEGAVWEGASVLRELVQQLQGQAQLPVVPVPASVQAELRPYQQQGLSWLQFLRTHGLAGILADDMGLGKTLQTLAHIQVEKEAGRLTEPALIIAPVSLMGNWQREAAKFCPQLRCVVFHGKERHNVAESLHQADIVIAPYSLLQRERERWLEVNWHLVVLDEAQNIKNASTQAAKVASELHARHRLCLSGTPIENHLGEIWSLFHFLMPGFLGSQKRFTEVFRTPIEKLGDSTRLAQLRARVTPFMLRRTKALVAADLPPKIETIMQVELTGKQADLYETIRLAMEQSVRQALEAQGLAKSQLTILDALLKLRQVCCDPHLVPLEAARKVQQSAKLDYLMEILPEMLAEGRRILLFSQFTGMLELIEAQLQKRQLPWVKLTGQSQNRDALIEQFTSGQVPLFLISLKAGGVGLNLPQADTVIHYDPWWNPAVENQATDRAHRIGQTQKLWVLKLVAQGTIEERILALQERKAQLADSMYSAATARREPLFTPDDLAELLKPLAH
jgi:superfamily II DNA or RNA helicase